MPDFSELQTKYARHVIPLPINSMLGVCLDYAVGQCVFKKNLRIDGYGPLFSHKLFAPTYGARRFDPSDEGGSYDALAMQIMDEFRVSVRWDGGVAFATYGDVTCTGGRSRLAVLRLFVQINTDEEVVYIPHILYAQP